MAGDLLPGAIYCEEAYAQGKMIDHSAWKLPRGSKPSDIDAVFSFPMPTPACFDNNGNVLYCEFSSSVDRWLNLQAGQRRLYQAAIKEGPHCAVICKHHVPKERQICSRNAVDSFQVMLFDYGFLFSDIFPGTRWVKFVDDWYEDPLRLRRRILGTSVGMKLRLESVEP